jgi:hypothetical protein
LALAVDKKERRELAIHELKDAEPGDLVLCEVSRAVRRGSRLASMPCSATRSRRAASR